MPTTGVTEGAHKGPAPLPMPIQALAPQLHLGISREVCFLFEDPRPSLHWKLLGSVLAGEGCAGTSAPHHGALTTVHEEGVYEEGKQGSCLHPGAIIFKGSTAVINAQPDSRASLWKPGWCRLLWGTSLCPSLVVRGSGSPTTVSVGNNSLCGFPGTCR